MPRFPRFFAFLNFFILMMLTLVLANNYLLLYVGWEGVGLASYLLIGFWFERPSAADAGKKAFLVNRIGDFGLALAIMFIWTTLGTLQFSEVFAAGARGLGRQRGRHHRDPAHAAGGHRQERTDSTLRLVAGRDGRPDAGLGPDPCCDHGDRRCVHAGSLGGSARVIAHDEHVGGGHRGGHGALCGDHRPHPDRSQAHPGLFYRLAARLHVPGSRRGRIRIRHLPPDDPRLLQGALVPGGRQRDARAGMASWTSARWATCARSCR